MVLDKESKEFDIIAKLYHTIYELNQRLVIYPVENIQMEFHYYNTHKNKEGFIRTFLKGFIKDVKEKIKTLEDNIEASKKKLEELIKEL